jgi:nucleoid-associated protein YgaU
VTRELKLALIVGFALVLVVTVLISDHLSHARQTKLALLPTDPAKVTEPLPIALENGANNLPQTAVTEPAPNAPAPLIGSMPGSDPEPVVIAQGNSGSLPLSQPSVTQSGTIDLINPHPQANQIAQNTGANAGASPTITPVPGSLEAAVREAGGRIEGNNILIPGVQTAREQVANTGGSGPMPVSGTPGVSSRQAVPLPVTLQPNTTPADRLHTVASGDNLFKISNKYYNDGKAWRKLAKYNGIDAETPLKVGQKIKVPTNDVLLGKPATNNTTLAGTPGTRPAVTPIPSGARPAISEPKPNATTTAAKTRPYTIKKGDSLAAIAQRELGTVKKAKDILELNRGLIKNPDNVPLGVTIQLPAA